ncbi:hypothetical protein [Deinococcus rufus]|uniref:Phage portal protein n=1 Tax=Deinococcus rufus TaxID=2136097 RepID=A0ABV7Z955_9DEIO
MILDQHGRPLPPSTLDHLQEAAPVQLRGGTLPTPGGIYTPPGWRDATTGQNPLGLSGRYGVTREYARRATRTMFFSNGLLGAAIDITAAFLVGDALSYGSFADPGLQAIVDDFWEANNLGELINDRLILEWFTDGEVAVVFPTERSSDRLPGADEPAQIGMLDVDLGGFSVEADTRRGATPAQMVSALQFTLPDNETLRWQDGEFVWAANRGGLWNDPRGWPVAYGAADFAAAYVSLLNMRLNVHHVQQRVLAVYQAILDPEETDFGGKKDGGVAKWQAKTRGFARLPERGGVLPVAIRPGYTDVNTGKRYDQVEENLKFLQPAQGASDAATDARQLMRMVGLTVGGLPEHMLGEGGNATRTTAAEMGLPSVRLSNKRQAGLGGLLTRIMRAEIRRRAGPGARFRSSKASRKRVPIEQIAFPWLFPPIREESMDQIIERVQLALDRGLISDETATGDLGYDPVVERDRRAGEAAGTAKPTTPPREGRP